MRKFQILFFVPIFMFSIVSCDWLGESAEVKLVNAFMQQLVDEGEIPSLDYVDCVKLPESESRKKWLGCFQVCRPCWK